MGKTYSESDLRKAISAVKQNRLKLNQAAREYCVPRATLFDHIKKRVKSNRSGRRLELLEAEEKSLVFFLQYMSDHGFPLTRAMIKIYAREILRRSGRNTRINLKRGPSNQWFRNFFKRNPELSERTPENMELSRTRMSNQACVDEWFIFSDGVLQKYGIKDMPCRKCLPHTNFKEGPPSSWLYATSESGYMDGEIFFEWFVRCFLSNCGKERPVCLIMDNHDSHITLPLVEKAMENDIILVGLPAHTTHILQPLDVKIIGPLKSIFNTIAERCGFLSPGFTISKSKFQLLLSYAIDQTAPASIKDAFKSTGIYPLSVEAIDKTQLIPASFKQPSTENALDAGTIELKTCPTYGVYNVNPLVKDGLVPQSLADVLMPPPAKPLHQKKTSRMILEGRVISGEDILMKLKEKQKALEEKKERQEERKRKRELKQEEQARKEEKKAKRREEKSKKTKSTRRDVCSQPGKRDRPSSLANPMYTCGVCDVRGRVDDKARGIEWVGCDESMCLAWYHFDCLCMDEKEYVRESLSGGNDWYCKVCKPWLYMEE